MRSFRRLWERVRPQLVLRRAWDQDGRRVWEIHFPPHEVRGPGVVPGIVLDLDSLIHPDRDLVAGPASAIVPGFEPAPADEVIDTRGVRIGDLKIDEYRYRIDPALIDLARIDPGQIDLSGRAVHLDVAGALAALAADPENETLRQRVVSRLAIAQDWFPGACALDISAARISGQGLGELFHGVFVWRAVGARHTFVYLVVPDLQVRALLIEDPELARALIQAACPRPGDQHGGELEGRLQEAITGLGVTAAPGRAHRYRVEIPDAAAVLVVKNADAESPDPGAAADRRPANLGAAADPRAANPGAASRPEAVAHQPEPAGRPTAAEVPAKSQSELALSAELAELARKVGVRAVRRPSTS